MQLRLSLVLFTTTLLLIACSGPSQTSTNDRGPSPEEERAAEERDARASVAEYETFDVMEYPIEPPEQTVEVTHGVPLQLMKGSANAGTEQTVDGFRIQVFSAQDQEAAEKSRERVRQWWEEVKGDVSEDLFRKQPPPFVIEYSQPYYRVRLGAFADREEADQALGFVRKEFSEAFVVRSTVTIVQ